jgi:hypothetical protein
MALMNGNKRIEGSRSDTALIKSGHASPAEEWILDPMFKAQSMSSIFREGSLFAYQYGGAGMEQVVIPKGRMVGVGLPIKDFVTKKMKSVLTLPGMTTNNNSVGMAPYNFITDLRQVDRFGGNQVSIITQEYVSLPYIPTVPASGSYTIAGILSEELALSVNLRMPWGAVIGAGIVEGDYVKSTPSGRLTKWVPQTTTQLTVAPYTVTTTGDDISLKVGQILASDFNQEQFGWLKWMLWNEADVQTDDNFINRSGGELPSDAGYPFDPSYRDGNNVFQFMQSSNIVAPTGIPNLHDGSGDYTGYGKNDTVYTDISFGSFDIEDNLVIGSTVALTKGIGFQAVDYAGGVLRNILNPVVISIGGVPVTDLTRITVAYTSGMVTIAPVAGDGGKEVTATFMAMHFGTSTYLDFKGVIGSFSVLLSK